MPGRVSNALLTIQNLPKLIPLHLPLYLNLPSRSTGRKGWAHRPLASADSARGPRIWTLMDMRRWESQTVGSESRLRSHKHWICPISIYVPWR